MFDHPLVIGFSTVRSGVQEGSNARVRWANPARLKEGASSFLVPGFQERVGIDKDVERLLVYERVPFWMVRGGLCPGLVIVVQDGCLEIGSDFGVKGALCGGNTQNSDGERGESNETRGKRARCCGCHR